jgi:hypothetical protein
VPTPTAQVKEFVHPGTVASLWEGPSGAASTGEGVSWAAQFRIQLAAVMIVGVLTSLTVAIGYVDRPIR